MSFLPPHADITSALGALVETTLEKVPTLGPRNPKVANAGVLALSRIDHHMAGDELSRLATRVSHRGALKLINAELGARAKALDTSRPGI
ncbi:hypothetical protein ACWC2K_36660 [Streptomyces chattanoogensis]